MLCYFAVFCLDNPTRYGAWQLERLGNDFINRSDVYRRHDDQPLDATAILLGLANIKHT
jgi:hypothetical protein